MKSMKQLIKPTKLNKNDTVAAVSLSWGGCDEFKNRYLQGKRQFEETFDVKIIEMPHTLSSAQDIYEHPEWRLQDLMSAFTDKNIKAILTTIGGDDTIRLLSLMNKTHFDIIRNNPKIFMGMSDTTVNHFMCFKAGLSSFYSPSLMFGYAENGGIPDYMVQNTKKTLFSSNVIGQLVPSKEFIVQKVPFEKNDIRQRIPTKPWRFIQGNTKTIGRLLGGCIDVLDFINGTTLWPKNDEWENAVLFIETSENKPTPDQLCYWLRNFAAQGILQKISGILFARPGGEFSIHKADAQERFLSCYTDYDTSILQVLKEYNCPDIPVVTNMDFGHTVPQFILPYGALCEIDPIMQTVSILESGVI